MTPTFTEEQKTEIRAKLISSGIELSQTEGLKKMTVALVAKSAGIATGTFYKFFESKESFVVEMIRDYETRAYDQTTACFINGRIELKRFLEVFRGYFRPENNFFLSLRRDDWTWCLTHIKDADYFTSDSAEKRILALIPHIDGIRKDADMRVAANFIKSIYSMYQNRETMFEDVLEKNVDLIFDTMYRYMKEE